MTNIKSQSFLLTILAKQVATAGSQAAWAEQHGISPQYVCDCLKGRRAIGQSIALALGFEPVTMYAQIEHKNKRRA